MKKPIFIDYNIGFDNIIFILSAIFIRGISLDTININISRDVKLIDINNIVNLTKLSDKNIKLIFEKNSPIINSNKDEDRVNEEVLDFIRNIDYQIEDSPKIMLRKLKESHKKASIISTGNLSNIAKMFLSCPEIKKNINKIVVVGGAIYGGNCTPCAEKNIFSDAYAADIVFNSGVPIIMCGLDVTEKTHLSNEEINELLECIRSSTNKYITDYIKNELICFFESLKISDKSLANLCGVIYASNPDIFKFDKCSVSVETGGEFTYGCTVVDINHVLQETRNVDVVYSLDIKKFVFILKNFLSNM